MIHSNVIHQNLHLYYNTGRLNIFKEYMNKQYIGMTTMTLHISALMVAIVDGVEHL